MPAAARKLLPLGAKKNLRKSSPPAQLGREATKIERCCIKSLPLGKNNIACLVIREHGKVVMTPDLARGGEPWWIVIHNYIRGSP